MFEKIRNQQFIVGLSLSKFLFNDETNQEHQYWMSISYLPIILRMGTGYSFQLPLNLGLTADKAYFEGAAHAVDLRLHLQFQDYLPGGLESSTDNELNTVVLLIKGFKCHQRCGDGILRHRIFLERHRK